MIPILVGLVFLSQALAAPISVTSYSGPNGQGQASGGTFNYWDLNYNGSGNTATDGAPLSGGTGDLTDGVIATGNWNNVENAAGTGPYVGWRDGFNSNPLITFFFGGSVAVDTITIYVDDSDNNGGVEVPISFEIGLSGGPLTVFPIADPSGTAPASFTFSGLGLTGNAIDIRFNHRSEWVFVSEVTFASAPAAVPEPAMAWLAGVGLCAVAVRRWWSRSSRV